MNYFLYHYFDRKTGPFRNLSSLPLQKAVDISKQINKEGKTFASQRSLDYIEIRRELEMLAREQFIAKGGKPKNSFPHYMTLGACDWLKTWYTNPDWIVLDWDDFTEPSISFTYGDLFQPCELKMINPIADKSIQSRRL